MTAVVDLRGYRKGYEPRLDILGVYTPNPQDIFRLGTGRLPPYQPVTTGNKLQAEMESLGVIKAWRISPEFKRSKLEKELPKVVAKTVADYDREYTITDLIKLAKEKGMSASGDKKAIIRRLLDAGVQL